MLYIDVRGIIDNESTKAMFEWWGEPTQVFTVDALRKVLAANPDEKEITLNIDCNGGSVEEGLKIYDELRMSGKTIHAVINGACHSMAIILLLAAPAENRSGNKNLRALIHRVSSEIGVGVTAQFAQQLADELLMEEEAILDIYAERTGKDVNMLRTVLRQEKMHDANSLLEMNFISRINSYNTNKYLNSMTNKIQSAWEAFKNRRKQYNERFNVGEGEPEPKNETFEYTDAEGTVVFTAEVPPEELAEGTVVMITSGETSGIFTLADGREVTIEDNIVDSIQAAPETRPMEERIAELEALLQDATNVAESVVAENERLVNELAARTGSNHKPEVARRSVVPEKANKNGADDRSVEAIKAAALAARNAKTINKQ